MLPLDREKDYPFVLKNVEDILVSRWNKGAFTLHSMGVEWKH